MYGYLFKLSTPVKYELTGKFQASSSEWIHENALLNDYELIVMTEGTLYLTYADVDYTVSEGDFLLLSPLPSNNHRKGFRPSKCSFYWLHFDCIHEVIRVCLSDVNLNLQSLSSDIVIPCKGTLNYSDKIIVLMKQLQDSIRSNYDYTAINYMTTTILCELYNQSYRENFNMIQTNYSKKQIYYDIVDYVKRNVHHNIRVLDIAEHFGYNKKYLSHMFGTIAGIPLKQFILHYKMEEANYLLTDTNQTINEIAMLLGFTDSHNFMKAYKKITGLTPTEYRNAFSKRLLFQK